MKIVCFYAFEWEKEYLEKKLADFDLQFLAGVTTDYPDFADDKAEIVCLFVDSPVDENFLKRFPLLKLIATRSTGFDHIDLGAAQKRSLKICIVPSYGKHAVAEYTFGLMIMVMRNLYEAYNRVRNNNFSRLGLCGNDLFDKTLGVIGTGDIGSNVTKIATAFGMKVCACDMKPSEDLVCQAGCTYTSLELLLSQSDVVSLHVPYTKGTHHLINKKNISDFKKGSFLINTARGQIVETAALVDGLQKGILAGAGLDVLEEEGVLGHEALLLTDNHPQEDTLQIALANQYLIDHPRVIVTAHNAFNSYEARKIILDCTIDNILSFVGGTPKNIIN